MSSAKSVSSNGDIVRELKRSMEMVSERGLEWNRKEKKVETMQL